MAEATRQDLDRLADRIERHADGHFGELREALKAHDERIRDVEVQLGRHGERLTAAERDGENQWTEITKIRNGTRAVDESLLAAPRGEQWRQRARTGGGLAILLGVLEILQQLGDATWDFIARWKG